MFVQGTWRIEVEKGRPEDFSLLHATTFTVEKYVLPKFQIIINSQQYILADVGNVTWNICVKYHCCIFIVDFQLFQMSRCSIITSVRRKHGN